MFCQLLLVPWALQIWSLDEIFGNLSEEINSTLYTNNWPIRLTHNMNYARRKFKYSFKSSIEGFLSHLKLALGFIEKISICGWAGGGGFVRHRPSHWLGAFHNVPGRCGSEGRGGTLPSPGPLSHHAAPQKPSTSHICSWLVSTQLHMQMSDHSLSAPPPFWNPSVLVSAMKDWLLELALRGCLSKSSVLPV